MHKNHFAVLAGAIALALALPVAAQPKNPLEPILGGPKQPPPEQKPPESGKPSDDDLSVPMHMIDEKGVGKSIGPITVRETKYGVVFMPWLKELPPGLHGFHVHEKASCEPKEKDGKMTAGQAAGGHLDPSGAGRHGTPWGDGHLGDLPALHVDNEGNATNPVLASRLKLADLKGRSLMIHAGGDNHTDHPQPMGGGGERLACGVVAKGS
jgi:superoxide dismutase, Cu-Zn family